MSFDLETLYSLLPSIYRIRDLEQSTVKDPPELPLQGLLQVIAEQVGILEENLAQLYDDQFIETCAEWVVPYIGDLVGYNTPHNTSSKSLRSEVAHTIGFRKRKGTAALLEQLVRDVTGWDAHVVEFFQLLATTQHMNRPRLQNSLVSLRGNGEPIDRLNTPFDDFVHTVDVRNITTGRGRYNIPNIGIFAWRLGDYSLTQVPAFRAPGNEGRCYFFNPFGNNMHLFTHPNPQIDVTQLAGPNAVAMPISRVRLANFLSDYYGRDKSILLTFTVDDQDIDILPDPAYASRDLELLIQINDALYSGLKQISDNLASKIALDLVKLQNLIHRSYALDRKMDKLYRILISLENPDVERLEKLQRLITTGVDLNNRLIELTSIHDNELQQLILAEIINLSTAIKDGLQPGNIDLQPLEDIFVITDLSDKLRIEKDGSDNTIFEKEKDSNGHVIWSNLPKDKVAIDPVTGRFALPENITHLLQRMGIPEHKKITENIRSTCYYGFSADMGGGEYHRSNSFRENLPLFRQVPDTPKPGIVQRTLLKSEIVQSALDALKSQASGDGVVEITNSGTIVGPLEIHAALNQRIELRAADFCRPLFVLEGKTALPELLIHGEEGSQVILNGLVISHGTLKVSGQLKRLTLRHCTIVPGLSLTEEGEPQHPLSASLVIESPHTDVEIDHCIVGSLRVIENAQVRISNSIVDATSKKHVAYAGSAESLSPTGTQHDEKLPGGTLHIENSTIIGTVHTTAIDLASNTIFLANGTIPVDVKRHQEGCIRYSYVPPDSITPRLYQCQPIERENTQDGEPQFTSLRYGTPGYCQLLQRSPVKTHQVGDKMQESGSVAEQRQASYEASIRQGADDEAEMGAFHDLFQPQRETNLRLRLEEYLRFTMEAGIIYMT